MDPYRPPEATCSKPYPRHPPYPPVPLHPLDWVVGAVILAVLVLLPPVLTSILVS